MAAGSGGASPSSSEEDPQSRRTSHVEGPRPASSSSSSSLSLTAGNGSGRRGAGGCRMLTSPPESGHSTALLSIVAPRMLRGEVDSGGLLDPPPRPPPSKPASSSPAPLRALPDTVPEPLGPPLLYASLLLKAPPRVCCGAEVVSGPAMPPPGAACIPTGPSRATTASAAMSLLVSPLEGCACTPMQKTLGGAWPGRGEGKDALHAAGPEKDGESAPCGGGMQPSGCRGAALRASGRACSSGVNAACSCLPSNCLLSLRRACLGERECKG